MGAYYQAVIDEVMYDVHSTRNGAKIMEHSYLGNSYCKAIEYKLFNKPGKLAWICDYHIKDEICPLDWDLPEDPIDLAPDDFVVTFVINHTKKLYFDLNELTIAYGDVQWKIHPLPLLTNSNERSLGGGDYYPEDSRRATWCLDTIETSNTKPEGYENVSKDVLFYEK